jgi:hypothetical protein
MITIEHRWTSAEPPRFGATVCTNCGLLCDMAAAS